MATRKIIIPLPTGTSDADKAERSHLMASRWGTLDKKIPRGELLANLVYAIDTLEADALVRKGVAKYVGADGKATDEQALAAKAGAPRPGTQEWKALPAEERVGSDEYREIQMQKLLVEAALKEAESSSVATAKPPTQAEQTSAVATATDVTEPSATPNGRTAK